MATFWGGFYEEIIGTVKRLLKRVRASSTLNLEQMKTWLTLMEVLINDHPLTTVRGQVVSPNHLVLQRRALPFPFVSIGPGRLIFTDFSLAMASLRERTQAF